MAASHIATSDDVTVTIPARCSQRFRREVLGELAVAADQVSEAAAWMLKDGPEEKDRLDARDLPRLRDADIIWTRIRDIDGKVSLTGPRVAVASLLRACVRSAAEELGASVDFWASAQLRDLGRELDDWADLFVATNHPDDPEEGR